MEFNDTATPAEAPEVESAGSALAPETPQSTPESTLYDVTADGQTLKVPLDELIRGYQRHSAFTRKTQEYSDFRREADEFRRQAEERINGLQGMLQQVAQQMRDKQAVREYLQELEGGAQQPQTQQELATAAQLQQAMQELARRNDTTVAQLKQSLEIEKQANAYRTQIDGFVGQLVQKHPELKAIPNADKLLKQAAAEARVGTLDDALSVMAEEARQMAAHIKAFVDYQRKQAAPKTPTPIPPSGGTPVAPPAAEVFRSVSDPRLKELAIRDLESMLAGS